MTCKRLTCERGCAGAFKQEVTACKAFSFGCDKFQFFAGLNKEHANMCCNCVDLDNADDTDTSILSILMQAVHPTSCLL